MARILEGIRVVDWSVLQVGPYAAAMLADLGADVIHVEEPGKGDQLRGVKTQYGMALETPQGRQVLFEEHNRNKRGLALNLKTRQGREVMYRLLDTADVFLTNLRTKAVARVGLDYETLKARNPRLIYAIATGFGPKGPDADSPSIDLIGQARSGAMLASGEEGMPPIFLTLGIGDRVTSYVLAYGVLAAIIARDRFGVGQKVETSQLAAMTLIQGNELMPVLLLNKALPRHSHKSPPRNALYNYYRCKDDRWIVLACWQDHYWPTLCQGIGRPELQHDPRFADFDIRLDNREALVEILDEVFPTKTGEEWYRALNAAGDLMFTLVNAMKDIPSDPQLLANDYITTWDHPALGKIKWPGFVVQFTETPADIRTPAPELGEHTEEILLELGYDWDAIAELREDCVI